MPSWRSQFIGRDALGSHEHPFSRNNLKIWRDSDTERPCRCGWRCNHRAGKTSHVGSPTAIACTNSPFVSLPGVGCFTEIAAGGRGSPSWSRVGAALAFHFLLIGLDSRLGRCILGANDVRSQYVRSSITFHRGELGRTALAAWLIHASPCTSNGGPTARPGPITYAHEV